MALSSPAHNTQGYVMLHVTLLQQMDYTL